MSGLVQQQQQRLGVHHARAAPGLRPCAFSRPAALSTSAERVATTRRSCCASGAATRRQQQRRRPQHVACAAAGGGDADDEAAADGGTSSSSSAASAAHGAELEDCTWHLRRLLDAFVHRRLGELVPYCAEMDVVRAVVKQHHARLQEQERLAAAAAPRYQTPAAAQEAASYYAPDAAAAAAATPAAYGDQQQQQQHHQQQQHYQPPSPLPPRPPCPVPGASPPPPPPYGVGASPRSGSPSPTAAPHSGYDPHRYTADYEAFNYASPPPPGGRPGSAAGAGSSSSRSWAWSSPSPGAAAAGPPGVGGVAADDDAAARGPPDFLAVLEAAQTGVGGDGGAGSDASHHHRHNNNHSQQQQQQHQLLDSYAMRHLILSRPASLEPLSCMLLAPGLFVARVRSTSLWGERCVLTLTLRRRPEAEMRSTYSRQPDKQPWVLARVAGEPLTWEPLEAIGPEHPPEAIVAAQVEAFRQGDLDLAFALTSPVGRAVAGTRDRFCAALRGDRRYRALLRHRGATSIHRTHSNANTYLEVVEVVPEEEACDAGGGSSADAADEFEGVGGGGHGHGGQAGGGRAGERHLFIWVATRSQLEGLYKNCWLVEYCTPVRDPEVIRALSLGP